MTSKNIYISTFRWTNHSNNSGYDQLARYMPGYVKKLSNHNTGNAGLFRKLLNKFFFLPNYKKLAHTQQYLLPGFITELYCVLLLLVRRRLIIHFIYGENEYSFLWKFKSFFKFKLIVTYHQPAVALGHVIYNPAILKHIDHVILMANSQATYFKDYVDEGKFVFVPHGVNTRYFLPSQSKTSEEKFNCIVVGNYLRDYHTLKASIEIIERKLPEKVVFNVVTNAENRAVLGDGYNIRYFKNISEDELLALYQSVHLCVCPLVDSTANNALLEGLACGLPVVVTDIGGSRDYGSDLCCLFVPLQNPEALAASIVNILLDEEKRLKMAAAAREHALAFDWDNIAKRMCELYII